MYEDYAIGYIDHICKTYGPRISSTEAELQATKDIEQELTKYCDKTYFDKFQVYSTFYPGGFVKIAAIFIGIGIPFLFLNGGWPIMSTLLSLFGLFVVFASLFGMKYWFAHGFQKGHSYNATGRILPRKDNGDIAETKARIIVAGHTDSAFQMKITNYGDNIYKVAIPGFLFMAGVILIGFILSIFNLINVNITIQSGPYFNLNYINLGFLIFSIIGFPAFIFLMRGLTGGTPVLGANDNLSGTGIALALAKYFSEDENRLKNVELWVGSFGSEECGERGSEDFVKKYGQLGYLDIAHAVIPDSAGAGDRLTIITEEKMHFATHDKDVTDRMYESYKKFASETENETVIPCEVKALPFAASDAGRFSLAGYKAGSLLVFEGELMKPKHWHSVEDRPEELDPLVMNASIELIKNYILSLEEDLEANSKPQKTNKDEELELPLNLKENIIV